MTDRPTIIDHAQRQLILSDDLRVLNRSLAVDIGLLARALLIVLSEQIERHIEAAST